LPRLKQIVLVRTAAVAFNPSDYKMGAGFPKSGAVVGMDFAGTAISIRDETETDLVVGDTVCGAVHGSNPAEPGNGDFAEYVRVPADILLRVPASLGPINASTLPTALATCIMSL
jgi:NADPH:quinone reductase-like Zn-dependent oxidoreductase